MAMSACIWQKVYDKPRSVINNFVEPPRMDDVNKERGSNNIGHIRLPPLAVLPPPTCAAPTCPLSPFAFGFIITCSHLPTPWDCRLDHNFSPPWKLTISISHFSSFLLLLASSCFIILPTVYILLILSDLISHNIFFKKKSECYSRHNTEYTWWYWLST